MAINYFFGNTSPPTTPAPIVNGKLPADWLKDVGDGRGKMLALPAEAMGYLHLAMWNRGFNLATTGRYRTYERQVELFLQRWSTTRQYNWIKSGVPQYVTTSWDGKVWYLKTGVARAAVPGTSPHGRGCADDVCELVVVNGVKTIKGLSDACLQVLIQEAPNYGFAWQATTQTPVERWHLQWFVGSTVPSGVKFFRDLAAPKPVIPVLSLGSTGPLVSAVQTIIKKISDPNMVVDGQFGPNTQRSWINFAGWFGQAKDGIVNSPEDWNLLAWMNRGWDELYAAGYPRP